MLLLLGIDDLARNVSTRKKVLFADYMSLLFIDSCLPSLKDVVCKVVTNWFQKNKQVVNIDKTNCMNFSLKHSPTNTQNLEIYFKKTKHVNETKLLGLCRQQNIK